MFSPASVYEYLGGRNAPASRFVHIDDLRPQSIRLREETMRFAFRK